ncbi:hypothetical protein P8625_12425 [Tenacibaculum tangerinum]|uniref:Lipocalin-like domain-containing protein n=1 Tax=Tenacibaculum tangerinum TaxID=3038772 RepID=A0ABY8L092_9FLAO|nr:hypothetical protein [Tenacibaculum tangerinum]WGH74874.1 hypothetical protein P8625_12425 [Tenacibaculum tangerinum]
MKKIFKISYAVLVCLTLVMSSCSDSDKDISGIANTELSGTVQGQRFEAKGGKAFPSGNNEVSVHITNIAADCSSDIFDYDLEISTYVSTALGIYNDVNVVFRKKGVTPLNYFNGTVELVRITDTELTVKIKAISSADNEVEGFFTVPYCQ